MAFHEKLKDLSDTEVIRRVINGGVDDYEIIVRRYNNYVYKVGRSYGYNHEDTEDLMQETYIDAYTHLQGFKGKASLKTWLVKIMLNNCYRKRRKLSYKNETPSSDKIGEQIRYPKHKLNDGDKTIQNLELKAIIEEAILCIPENYRKVYTLRELNGLSTIETAVILEISESNVKVKLSRARKMLQEEIGKLYSPSEIFEFNLIYCDGLTERVIKAIKEL
ncbi:MAG TPA: sigma-70 family RNA polymerase sigma factor [Chitinophagales bacterium]|nr:sigma-70 family RNA polymerase sigma factor [Chitinophagales bacterium]